MLETAKVIERR